MLAIGISAGIFATTIHSQDFKDVDGDRAIGRQTIPIVYPYVARYTVLFPLIAWSLGLSFVWGMGLLECVCFTLMATYIGVRYIVLPGVKYDQISFYWYNVSIRDSYGGVAYDLPIVAGLAFGRPFPPLLL